MNIDEQIRWVKLVQMQSLPLEEKINASIKRIYEWFSQFPAACVSFSGGKDSTVLLHLIRSIFPETKAIFADTGLEFPEIRDFVKTIKNVEWVKPKISFLEVIQKYGYPVVSKMIAQYVGEHQKTKSDILRRLRETGYRSDGSYMQISKVSECWKHLLKAPFMISDKCCRELEKKPMDLIGDHPFIGTMASDGDQRKASYLRDGCNAFKANRPSSRPLSFWLESDIWEYIKTKDVQYSKIYDMGYTRTGCIFCMFGVGMELKKNKTTRFHRLFETHPQLYKYCMDGPLKLRDVIRFTHGIELPY